MRRPSFRVVAAFILVLLAALLLGVKLFTTEVSFADEPSIGVALRLRPHQGNSIQLRGPEDVPGIYLLFIDENDYVGGPLYRFVVGGGWWAGCAGSLVLALACLLLYPRRRNCS
jgi:hypothetical protein